MSMPRPKGKAGELQKVFLRHLQQHQGPRVMKGSRMEPSMSMEKMVKDRQSKKKSRIA